MVYPKGTAMHPAQYLRRKQAGAYLKDKYGFGSEKTLAKLATVGGGPAIFYAGRLPLYIQEKLDAWAQAKISPPVHSTSEKNPQGCRGRPRKTCQLGA
jgi:hypothetical protein